MTKKALLDPKLLGFWVRCMRDTEHLSQEALAAAANVTVRTIQRFAGQPDIAALHRSGSEIRQRRYL